MKFSFLLSILISLVLSAPTRKLGLTNCGKDSDLIQIENVTISSTLVQSNTSLEISFTSVVTQNITGGFVDYKFKYGKNATVVVENVDFCALGDVGFGECPISKGVYNSTQTFLVPAVSENTTFSFTLTAEGGSSNSSKSKKLMCLSGRFLIVV